MKNEVWKDINGYWGLYKISNYGRVMSLNYLNNGTSEIMKQDTSNGYCRVILQKNKKTDRVFVHRLVAQHFIDNESNLPQVNHRDENKLNNHVDNLEWCSAKYNSNYGTRLNRLAELRKKPIEQYSLDGKFIRNWSSASDVDCEDCHFRGISACLRGVQKTHRNYIWKYKEDN